MTSISLSDRCPGAVKRGMPIMRAVFAAVGIAGLVCLAGLGLLTGYTAPDGIRERMVTDMQMRIEAIPSPAFQCGRDAKPRADGDELCREMAGFRVKYGRDLRIFSTRYRDPLFIFGMEKGLIFTNDGISNGLMKSEKAAFSKSLGAIETAPGGQ